MRGGQPCFFIPVVLPFTLLHSKEIYKDQGWCSEVILAATAHNSHNRCTKKIPSHSIVGPILEIPAITVKVFSKRSTSKGWCSPEYFGSCTSHLCSFFQLFRQQQLCRYNFICKWIHKQCFLTYCTLVSQSANSTAKQKYFPIFSVFKKEMYRYTHFIVEGPAQNSKKNH